jgi:hypothetical protein
MLGNRELDPRSVVTQDPITRHEAYSAVLLEGFGFGKARQYTAEILRV